MSSIARKLCDEIVQPINVKPSDLKYNVLKCNDLQSDDEKIKDPNSNNLKSNSGVSSSYSKSSSKPSISSNRIRYSKPTRTIVIKKEKEINKIVPQGKDKALSINKFKSKETFKKDFIDTGANTIATGPLRCDTDCITAVRTRDKCCTHAGTRSCRCSKLHKPIPKCVTTDSKNMQTLDPKPYCLMDNKACTQCVETASFGMVTPFGLSENATPRNSCYRNRIIGSQLSSPIQRPKGTRLSFMEPDDRVDEPRLSCNKQRRSCLDSRQQECCRGKEYGYDKEYGYASSEPPRSKTNIYGGSYTKTTFGSCNRWSIAQYPTRGPDF